MVDIKKYLKKAWHFLWHDDSFASFIANIIVAFIIIKFVVYPGLGLIFGTDLPIVAVVSSSMEHNLGFEEWWGNAQSWYNKNQITKEDFLGYPLKSGFNKGDIMLVSSATESNIELGDVIIFNVGRENPIIHRVVKIYNENMTVYYQTKGDNYKTNPVPLQSGSLNELKIPVEAIRGKALFRIPFIGYIKIFAVDVINLIR
ncbi:signal peptidase I [Candidatus Woesearchaeota archaeon]|nr:signal peptidase I [Candidatus Woesearchaeota archaeon]